MPKQEFHIFLTLIKKLNNTVYKVHKVFNIFWLQETLLIFADGSVLGWMVL